MSSIRIFIWSILALYGEITYESHGSSHFPPGSLEGFGHLGSWESGQVRVQPDGSAIVYTGASPHGQGTVTTLASLHLKLPQYDRNAVDGSCTVTCHVGCVPVAPEAGCNGVREVVFVLDDEDDEFVHVASSVVIGSRIRSDNAHASGSSGFMARATDKSSSAASIHM